MLRLIQNPGLLDEKAFEVRSGITMIGRTPENDVCVLDRSLSRRHARLERDGDRIFLVDLRSKNGTFVKGERIERHELHPWDRFSCGEVSFLLAPAAVQPPSLPLGVMPSFVQDAPDSFMARSMAELLDDKTGGSALRVRHWKVEERAQDKLRVLLKVSQLLSSPEAIDSLLERILGLVFQILDVDRAAILLVDPATGELRPRVVKGSTGDTPAGHVYSQQIVEWVRSRGAGALFTDARIDPRLDASASVIQQSICASMCVPLKLKDQFGGVLYVDNLSTANRFTQEDMEFLTAFANQAALSIENATLYRRLEEEAVLRNNYLRFFPPATLKRLELSRGALLEVIETEVTILFSDISGFTALSSTLSPPEVVELLNEYFPIMAGIVFHHEGTLEKYIGDALLAVWGAPFSHPDDPDRAVRAAVEMQQAMAELNRQRRARGEVEYQVHIGLNTGRVAAGNIGSEQYLQYATVGDATNVASRICAVAQPGEIILSAKTWEHLRDPRPPAVRLPPAQVKGKTEALELYRVDWSAEHFT